MKKRKLVLKDVLRHRDPRLQKHSITPASKLVTGFLLVQRCKTSTTTFSSAALVALCALRPFLSAKTLLGSQFAERLSD